MRLCLSLAVASLFYLTAPADAFDTTSLTACGKISEHGKAKLRKDTMSMIMLAPTLIDADNKSVQPKYDAPAESCLLPPIRSSAGPILPVYSPFQKGTQTLLYRFLSGEGKDAREFLVLYNGTMSLMAGGKVFFLSETRGTTTNVYAIFNSQPRLKELKKMVPAVMTGKLGPVVSVSWPEGAKGAEVALR